MICNQTRHHPLGATKAMNSLPYKLTTTNDQLTSRAGLLTVALMMERLTLSKHLDEAFPKLKSNRTIAASSYLETLILMQNPGLFHLDDVKHRFSLQSLLYARAI